MTDAFLPYSRQRVTDSDVEAVIEALRSPIISQGSVLEAFESSFAQTLDARFAVALSSGTAALHAMCAAAGLGPGDEVVVPAITFAATANAVLYTGAKPVFVDIDPSTACIDPVLTKEAVTNKTRAILAVDLAGHPADYHRLAEIAAAHGLRLLSDAAHSPGATVGGAHASSFTEMAAFSFNPVKNVTSAEGGVVLCREESLAQALRQFRTHGMTSDPDRLAGEPHGAWYYEQQVLGFNYKLSELHAALGLSQIKRLGEHTDARRRLAALYDQALADLPVRRPKSAAGVNPAWHLYVIRTDADVRRRLFDHLRAAQIGVQVHYIPVPMHPYYRRLGYDMVHLDNAQAYYDSAISLPLHPSMSDADVGRVVDSIRAFFARSQ